VLAQELKDDGTFPNSRLPLLLYRKAVLVLEHDLALAQWHYNNWLFF
jgi:hypothetical protein